MVRPCRRLRNHSPELRPSNRAAAPLPLVCNGAASSPTESVVAQLTARSRSSVADVGRIAGPDDVAGWDCSGSDCDSPLESPCRSLRVTALHKQLCAADLVGSSHEPVGYLDVSARTRETRTSLPPALAREPSTGWTWRLSCVQLEMLNGRVLREYCCIPVCSGSQDSDSRKCCDPGSRHVSRDGPAHGACTLG